MHLVQGLATGLKVINYQFWVASYRNSLDLHFAISTLVEGNDDNCFRGGWYSREFTLPFYL